MKQLTYILFFAMLIASSCNKDEVITTTSAPEITLDNESGIYTVKIGDELRITPSYKYSEEAIYSWSTDGNEISNSPALIYSNNTPGTYYITITVTTDSGEASEEIRIEVMEREIPYASVAGSNIPILMGIGSSKIFVATVAENSLETTYSWNLDGVWVSDTLTYLFKAKELGNHEVQFIAKNSDGADTVNFSITVCTPEELPVSWYFAQKEYNTSAGRTIRIAPTEIINAEECTYEWKIENRIVANATEAELIFIAESEGIYQINVTATKENKEGLLTLSETLIVNVSETEGKYYRPMSEFSHSDWNKVYEYTPAPGQFINETLTGGFNGSETSPEKAIEYAERRLKAGQFVSLGGFGGYIVAGFDHSIDNNDGYDFAIKGNSFSGSSEPGIVWVMQDENGDGKPNDIWYELKGCETGAEGTIQDYAVTYYKPVAPDMPVLWSDNLGNSGQIDYLSEYHKQEFYYPAWIQTDSYTLYGTRLEARNYDKSGNGALWIQPEYEWGYADNFSPIDRLSSDSNSNAQQNSNHFDIANAIDYAGNPIELKYIDFVKVQCGVNAKSGWTGELSTELFGIYDYSLFTPNS